MEKEYFQKIGFTIGKFAPLHKGHQFVIETARKEMDKVIVVVYDTDLIAIPTEKRANWIRKLYPDVIIKYAHHPPMQYGLDKKSVGIQMEFLSKILVGEKPTHFYSSEPYGEYVAKYMGIIDRRVDEARIIVPIRATALREDIEANKQWVERMVYLDCKSCG